MVHAARGDTVEETAHRRTGSSASESLVAGFIFVLNPDGQLRRFWDCVGLSLIALLVCLDVLEARWSQKHAGWLHADLGPDSNPFASPLASVRLALDNYFLADILVKSRLR